MATRIGLDLGTSNSIIAVVGKKEIISEPTVVAISTKDKKVVAIGNQAKGMLGKVPVDIEARRPIRQGVIASYKLTEMIISHLMQKVLGKVRFFKPEVMISVPAGITSVEERAVIEACVQAGAGKVFLIPEPIAAAIGANMPISGSAGNMIISMGGGTSEIAVMSMNGIVTYESKRLAGDALNEAMINFIRKKTGLVIGEQMAERIKIEIGSAVPVQEELTMEVRGRDGTTGMPTSIELKTNDVVEGFKPVLSEIIASIKEVLERTPPELSSDIIDRGMVLTGGTAMLRNIDDLFTKATGVSAHVVEEPELAVIRGIIYALNNLEHIQRILRG
ncbi:MAG TPA: rod shape-determining protein [Candidatus Dojkabacteria bacterium]|jgi:rod shape-determining protein MreB|nr:rod shape-determining protein [Candidatus Dojkabacteria bacterium]